MKYVDPMGREKEVIIRLNIIKRLEEQYIYWNSKYSYEYWFSPSRKCNIFVWDAYTIGWWVSNYPRYEWGDNYPIANDLASSDKFVDDFLYFTDTNLLRKWDIVAWKNTLNPGHTAIYWWKNYNTWEDMVIYAWYDEIKFRPLNDVTRDLQAQDQNPDNHQNHLDPIFRSFIF